MSFAVYSSTKDLSPEDALSLPRASIGSCWSGVSLPAPFSWSVAVDTRALWFVCELPGGLVYSRAASKGAFVEGLWEEDVAELFIKASNGSYQELNFAPSGAWWSMTMSAYRARSASARRPELLHISTSLASDRWEVVAAVALDSLQVAPTSSCSMHVSGMWYQPSPRFLSSQPATGSEPDYHNERCFQSASIVGR